MSIFTKCIFECLWVFYGMVNEQTLWVSFFSSILLPPPTGNVFMCRVLCLHWTPTWHFILVQWYFRILQKWPMFDQEYCSPLFGDTFLEVDIITTTPQKLELELISNCEKAESLLQRAFQRQEVRTVPVAKSNEELVFVWVFNKSPIQYSLETRAGCLLAALKQVSS